MNLRPYQQAAIASIYRYFEAGNAGNPLVVAPTGSGKSLLIADFVRGVCESYKDQRILILSHVKEILEQNASKLLQFWPGCPLGVYSAGLGSRRINQITIAGIQSVFSKAETFGHFDLILIDECHLIPKKGQGRYLTFISAMREINPNLKIIGFTATPFRLDSGLLHQGEGRIFTDICYNISISELIKDGFLSPLIGKNAATQADLSEVRIRGGEFLETDSARAMDKEELTRAAIKECLKYASDRSSWLVFCTGIEHANHVCEELTRNNIFSKIVTGETPKFERKKLLEDFKNKKIKALCNCNVLTTGFDAPNTDAIILLRPTQSTGLYCQIVGRGMRPAQGKQNCLVLDFAGNIERHGPITEIIVKSGKGATGDKEGIASRGPIKTCPSCRSIMHPAVKECLDCGYIFPIEPKHDAEATNADPLARSLPQEFEVLNVSYKKNEKPERIPTLRVDYLCLDARIIMEWICFEHPAENFARQKAVRWWRERAQRERAFSTPKTIDEALARISELKPIKSLRAKKDGKYWRILSAEFKSKKEIDAEKSTQNYLREAIGI